MLCDRGINARTDKSLAVRDAGGVGMILCNTSPNSLNADFHFVPTVHVDDVDRRGDQGVHRVRGAGATARLSARRDAGAVEAPAMAAFSSSGPAIAGGGDLLKPDITAPGVDVVAARLAGGHNGNLLRRASPAPRCPARTSPASPPCIRAAHPGWSPIGGQVGADDHGEPDSTTPAADPARRVSNATPVRLRRPGTSPRPARSTPASSTTPARETGSGTAAAWASSSWSATRCATVGSVDPSDLNYPSIAVGASPGTQTVTRTVTNVSNQPSVYVASVTAPQGLAVTVTPSTLTVAPGKSATFQVTITRTDAEYRTWTFGSLTWSDLRGHTVRSPIGARPVALAGPGEVTGTGAAGTTTIDLTGGYTGTITTSVHGLVPSLVNEQKLVGSTAAFVPTAPTTGPAVFKFGITVPSGTEVARLATYAADHAPGTDVDLYVYQNGELVDRSDGTAADEEIALTSTGVFEVYVVRFTSPAGADSRPVRAHTYLVGGTPAGNLTVTPGTAQVTPDRVVRFDVAWKGLDPAKRYLGMVEFGDGTTARAWTTVTVGPFPAPATAA